MRFGHVQVPNLKSCRRFEGSTQVEGSKRHRGCIRQLSDSSEMDCRNGCTTLSGILRALSDSFPNWAPLKGLKRLQVHISSVLVRNCTCLTMLCVSKCTAQVWTAQRVLVRSERTSSRRHDVPQKVPADIPSTERERTIVDAGVSFALPGCKKLVSFAPSCCTNGRRRSEWTKPG